MSAKKVPMCADLVAMGLAVEVTVRTGAKSTAKVYRISEEGRALLNETMRANALEALERGEGEWKQPPSRRIPGLSGG